MPLVPVDWCRPLLATVTAQVLETARVLLLDTAWALSQAQVLVWARARVLLLAGGSYPQTCDTDKKVY